MAKRVKGTGWIGRSGDRGFSLIELMVIIVIAGILASIAWVRMSQLAPKYRLEGAARNLAIEIQKARQRAITENKCSQVVLNVSTMTYTAQTRALNAATCAGSSGSWTSVEGTRKIDDSGTISMDDGSGGTPVTPIFTPRGRAEDTGNVYPTIRLSNVLGDGRQVMVNQVGRVIVQ